MDAKKTGSVLKAVSEIFGTFDQELKKLSSKFRRKILTEES